MLEKVLIQISYLERLDGDNNGMADNGIFLTTRFGKRNGPTNDVELIENKNQDAILIGREFWLPKNTAQDLEYKMQDLENYMSRYYDNARSKDFLRL